MSKKKSRSDEFPDSPKTLSEKSRKQFIKISKEQKELSKNPKEGNQSQIGLPSSHLEVRENLCQMTCTKYVVYLLLRIPLLFRSETNE